MAEVGRETDATITTDNVLGLKGNWRWFHVKISNGHNDQIVKNCFALILSTKEVNSGNVRNLNAGLKWEDTNDSIVSIPTGVEKQFECSHGKS
jgi:hypothetical protein